MTVRIFVAGALLAVAGTSVLAQNTTREPIQQRPQTMRESPQSVTPTARMNDSSRGMQPGTSGNGTPVQPRGQGMAPNSPRISTPSGPATGASK